MTRRLGSLTLCLLFLVMPVATVLAQDAPSLPPGLEDEGGPDLPALPEGLEEEDSDLPALPEGLGDVGGADLPGLPEGLGGEDAGSLPDLPEDTAGDEGVPSSESLLDDLRSFGFRGFLDVRSGMRLRDDGEERDCSLAEARLQIGLTKQLGDRERPDLVRARAVSVQRVRYDHFFDL